MSDNPQPGEAHGERRRNRRLLVVVLLMLAVPVVAVGGYLGWLNHLVTSNIFTCHN